MADERTLAALLDVGERMSNFCFNKSQDSRLGSHEQEQLKKLCNDWDHYRRLAVAEKRRANG